MQILFTTYFKIPELHCTQAPCDLQGTTFNGTYSTVSRSCEIIYHSRHINSQCPRIPPMNTCGYINPHSVSLTLPNSQRVCSVSSIGDLIFVTDKRSREIVSNLKHTRVRKDKRVRMYLQTKRRAKRRCEVVAVTSLETAVEGGETITEAAARTNDASRAVFVRGADVGRSAAKAGSPSTVGEAELLTTTIEENNVESSSKFKIRAAVVKSGATSIKHRDRIGKALRRNVEDKLRAQALTLVTLEATPRAVKKAVLTKELTVSVANNNLATEATLIKKLTSGPAKVTSKEEKVTSKEEKVASREKRHRVTRRQETKRIRHRPGGRLGLFWALENLPS
ncbi:hypothetical protein KC19_VG202600 [Ceratodon purpureus]|uniref:Uncharacterized protein n=1 Tax=Ceratodon purpureus TaxID=3225 RepID=A0A8T0HS89_CERPU|nr:hypothetical protein KC19_VG202600 [Ceratodon purpureus]